MARALVGYIGQTADHRLTLEVARLRNRVAELETELAALRATTTAELAPMPELPGQVAEFDLEFHRLASESEPALA